MPRYCRVWPGVSCDANYYVTGIDLTALHLKLTKPLTLKEVAGTIKSLKKLQSLVLSDVGLAGKLDAPAGEGLAALANLQHLDLSNNLELGGNLPDWLAGLTALQTINISHTSVGGALPASYVSLQQLREFRAVSCTTISGTLPMEYALLQRLEVLEISGSGLSGPLPTEWGDSPNMRAAHSIKRASVQVASARVQQAAAQAQIRNALATGGPLQPTNAVNSHGRGSGTFAISSNTSQEAPTDLGGDSSLADYYASQLEASAAKRALASLRSTNFSSATIGMLSLQELRLPNNNLSGSLPDSFANMKQLRVFDVSQSAPQHSGGIEGRLPAKWAALQNLKVNVLAELTSCKLDAAKLAVQ